MVRFSKTLLILAVLLAGVFLVFQPIYNVNAAGLVPCGRSQDDQSTTDIDESKPCEKCDVFLLTSKVINFVIFTITPAVAVLLFLIAGFMILLGGANPGLVGSGRNIFKTTVWGLFLIFTAWMITNTILKSLAGEKPFAKDWYKITCVEGIAPVVPIPSGVTCDGPSLATQYVEPYPRQNSPLLDNLMSCISSKMGTAILGEISTYDRTYELCNYTRGNRITGCTSSCSHAVNSCHYGGETGINGALAVDYGNEVLGDQIIAAALKCGAKSARCETSSGSTVTCSSSSASHVHVNSASCDKN